MPSRLSRTLHATRAASLALAAATAASVVHAAPQDGENHMIDLELNGLQETDTGCRIAFVAHNGLARDIGKAAYEIALFDRQGLVDRLLVLDFKALPASKTKVRRFDLADTDCDAIGRVLINDVSACEGDGIEPGECIARLNPTSRGNVTFGK